VEHDDDGNAPNPGSSDLGPNVGTLEGPRCKQYDELICLFQELTDIFFELRPYIDIGFIEKRMRSLR
jgi:hypothetical protein